MSDEVALAQQITLREAGYDEYWLQRQITENPACLGLGDLETISTERRQSSGGRLDILLKDPADDAMYEVEVMLGETDETHIIRTIEYRDNEKRIWPLRQHFAVLVAEQINRRFFNVIHLLSYSIPIIAIQTSLLSVNQSKSLFFSKILDTYEEIDDGRSLDDRSCNREYWLSRAKWTLDAADALLQLTSGVLESAALSYLKSYIAINVGGDNYMWLHKRSSGKSLLTFRISSSLQEQAAGLLESCNITPVRKPKGFSITFDKEIIANNSTRLVELANLIKRSWAREN